MEKSILEIQLNLRRTRVLGSGACGVTFSTVYSCLTEANKRVPGHIDGRLDDEPAGSFYNFDITYYWGK